MILGQQGRIEDKGHGHLWLKKHCCSIKKKIHLDDIVVRCVLSCPFQPKLAKSIPLSTPKFLVTHLQSSWRQEQENIFTFYLKWGRDNSCRNNMICIKIEYHCCISNIPVNLSYLPWDSHLFFNYFKLNRYCIQHYAT